MSRVLLVTAVLAGGLQTAVAQNRLEDLGRGARVRVLAPAVGVKWPARATIDSMSADSLYVRELSDPPNMRGPMRTALPLTGLRLDVPYKGQSRTDHAAKGLLWGLGAYLVFATAVIVHERATCSGDECFGEGYGWIGLAAGVPYAAGLGAAAGFVLPVRQWRTIFRSPR